MSSVCCTDRRIKQLDVDPFNGMGSNFGIRCLVNAKHPSRSACERPWNQHGIGERSSLVVGLDRLPGLLEVICHDDQPAMVAELIDEGTLAWDETSNIHRGGKHV